jgi:hypothetical protein
MSSKNSTFSGRIAELMVHVGAGLLEGKVEVDQAYAYYQHEDTTLRHYRGGGAQFLRGPLYARQALYLKNLADHVLDGSLVEAMAENMEDLSQQVAENAPRLFGNLQESGHPSVTSNGVPVYDRPPRAPRLTEKQITEQHRLHRGEPGQTR